MLVFGQAHGWFMTGYEHNEKRSALAAQFSFLSTCRSSYSLKGVHVDDLKLTLSSMIANERYRASLHANLFLRLLLGKYLGLTPQHFLGTVTLLTIGPPNICNHRHSRWARM